MKRKTATPFEHVVDSYNVLLSLHERKLGIAKKSGQITCPFTLFYKNNVTMTTYRNRHLFQFYIYFVLIVK